MYGCWCVVLLSVRVAAGRWGACVGEPDNLFGFATQAD